MGAGVKSTPSPNSDRVRNSSGEIRLNLVKGVVNYDFDPDLDFLKGLYKKWVTHDEYLVLREEETLPNHSKGKWFAVKCSKRGNDVYQSRIRRRLKDMFGVFKSKMKGKKARGIRKTNALYLTLSYDTKLKSRGEAWLDIGKEWNRFLSALKKKFGKLGQIRSWETYENGYPHIHSLVFFEKKEFAVWWQKPKKKGKKGKWRVKKSIKDTIADMWHSFVDVQGVVDLKEGLENVTWYVLKEKKDSYKNIEEWGNKELLTAVACWFFRKRSFSMSGNFIEFIKGVCVIQTKNRVQSTLEGKKACKEYELLGIIARSKTEIDSYVWCKTYKKAPKWVDQVQKIRNCSDDRMKHTDFFK